MGTPGTLKKQTMQVFGIRMLQLVGGKKKKKAQRPEEGACLGAWGTDNPTTKVHVKGRVQSKPHQLEKCQFGGEIRGSLLATLSLKCIRTDPGGRAVGYMALESGRCLYWRYK